MTPVERLLSKLPDAKQSGDGWSTRCSAHEDRHASLSIGEGKDGRVLVKCHAGCKAEAVCAAVGLRLSDLMPTKGELTTPLKSSRNGKPRIVAEHDYCDEKGNLLFQVVRMEPKDFRQRRPKPGGGWIWDVKGVRVVPYRLPELLAAPSNKFVFVVEGEKDVNSLADIGIVATCNAGGAAKWIAEHAAFLANRFVVVIADNDSAGADHASKVCLTLHQVARSVRLVQLPGLPEKGDVSDWLAAGGTKDELKPIIVATSEWTPKAEPWPEPESFDVLNLPEFPTRALPDVLRQWVEAESHATQTPADLAARLALSVCSVGIAWRVVVEPRPGWHEPVNLFTAVLLEPGNRKSAVFSDAMKPAPTRCSRQLLRVWPKMLPFAAGGYWLGFSTRPSKAGSVTARSPQRRSATLWKKNIA